MEGRKESFSLLNIPKMIFIIHVALWIIKIYKNIVIGIVSRNFLKYMSYNFSYSKNYFLELCKIK